MIVNYGFFTTSSYVIWSGIWQKPETNKLKGVFYNNTKLGTQIIGSKLEGV